MFAVIFVVQPKKGRMDDYRNQAKLLSKAKVETISELSPAKGEKPAGTNLAGDLGLPKTGSEGVIEQEVFESITNPGKLLLLVAWRDAAAAGRWKPKAVAAGKLRHRHVRVIRQYGMSDRREAPQFYPEVKKAVQKTERATAVGPGRVRRRQSPRRAERLLKPRTTGSPAFAGDDSGGFGDDSGGWRVAHAMSRGTAATAARSSAVSVAWGKRITDVVALDRKTGP